MSFECAFECNRSPFSAQSHSNAKRYQLYYQLYYVFIHVYVLRDTCDTIGDVFVYTVCSPWFSNTMQSASCVPTLWYEWLVSNARSPAQRDSI